VVCKVYDTPDAPKNEQFIKDYILSSDNYVTEEQIEQDHAKRFKGKDTVRTRGTAKPEHGAASKPDRSETKHDPAAPKADVGQKAHSSKASSKRKVAWDNLLVEAPERQDPGAE